MFKKPARFILIVIALILAASFVYWQYNKKRIVRNAVEKIVTKKTDSLYFIHYDSSSIDAINGNASFYNVTLQSDSLQQQLAQFDSSSAPAVYNIHVGEISIKGANIPALLSNDKVAAKSIKIIRPVIFIMASGTKKEKPFSREDTLTVYQKLLGRFNSIQADEIIIEDGQLSFAHKIQVPGVSLSGININIKNVLIDSSRNYDNLVSYFIKDATLSVKNAYLKDDKTNSILTFRDLDYNALQKWLRLGNFQQKNNDSVRVAFDINNTYIKGLNTDSFILRKQLKADELVSDGGLMTFYRKRTQDLHDDRIEIDNNFFDEALLNKITLHKTKVLIYNRDKPAEAPFVLNNVQFSADKIQNLYSGTNIKNLISHSNWNLSADGFSFITADKIYKLDVGAFEMSKLTHSMHIDRFAVIPQLSTAAFVKTLKEQKDLFNVTVNNIDIKEIDLQKLITQKILTAGVATLQPVIKISNDRTITPGRDSKIGNYPHQILQKIKFPFYVKKIVIKDGHVSYTERSALSAEYGTVRFSIINGVINNVTNVKDYISKNNLMNLNVNAKFMDVSNLQTKWTLPLNSTNGSFAITGYASGFDARALNPLIEPLALASIQKGNIKSLDFNIYGTDNEAKGTSILLYNDLQIEALKKDSNDLKKRDVISFIANLLIKDDNPKNNIIRKGEIDIERDKTRSFFNLLWKGIFKAAKRTALGRNDK